MEKDLNDIKKLCRDGLSTDMRLRMWPIALNCNNSSKLLIPTIDESHVISQKLMRSLSHSNNTNEISAFNRILACLAVRNKKKLNNIQNRYLSNAVEKVLFPNIDQQYYEISLLIAIDLFNNRCPKSQLDVIVDCLTFKNLLAKTMPKTFKVVDSMGCLSDTFLSGIFVDVFSAYLPLAHVTRIFDSYLIEGNKILFRYGIAIFRCMKQGLKEGQYANADHFWGHVKSDPPPFADLHSHAFDTKRSIYSKLLRPMGISRNNLKKLSEQNLALAAKDSETDTESISAATSNSTMNLIANDSRFELSDQTKQQLYNQIESSCILPGGGLHDCLYRLSRDGTGLAPLYNKLKGHRGPILLLVKTRTQGVVGAFLSSAPVPPNETLVRGDGTSFVFSVHDRATIFKWSGCASPSTYSQFCVASNHTLLFGASAKHGTSALRLNEDLSEVASGHTDTFGNPASIFKSGVDTDKILDVEVIG